MRSKGICKNGGQSSWRMKHFAYPECCVKSHYLRAEGWNWATLSILSRHAEANEDKMRELLSKDELPPAETKEEKLIYQSALTRSSPLSLVVESLCAKCRGSSNSPSAMQIEKKSQCRRICRPRLSKKNPRAPFELSSLLQIKNSKW